MNVSESSSTGKEDWQHSARSIYIKDAGTYNSRRWLDRIGRWKWHC